MAANCRNSGAFALGAAPGVVELGAQRAEEAVGQVGLFGDELVALGDDGG